MSDSFATPWSHSLLQGILPTQGLKLCRLKWQADSLPEPQGKPINYICFYVISINILIIDVDIILFYNALIERYHILT